MNKVSLQWNHFDTDLRETFIELRENGSSFDVTLATDDGHIIEAHKLILTAGSEFFKNILKNTQHPKPYIHLKGVRRLDLEHAINFLYHGKVDIAQDDLVNFLEISQDLQVKGIQSTQKIKSQQNEETVVLPEMCVEANIESSDGIGYDMNTVETDQGEPEDGLINTSESPGEEAQIENTIEENEKREDNSVYLEEFVDTLSTNEPKSDPALKSKHEFELEL